MHSKASFKDFKNPCNAADRVLGTLYEEDVLDETENVILTKDDKRKSIEMLLKLAGLTRSFLANC